MRIKTAWKRSLTGKTSPRIPQARAGIACAGAKSARVNPQRVPKAGRGEGRAGHEAKVKGGAIASTPCNRRDPKACYQIKAACRN